MILHLLHFFVSAKEVSMKRFILIIAACLFLVQPALAGLYLQDGSTVDAGWKQYFQKNVSTKGLEQAIMLAMSSDVPIQEIARFALDMDFDQNLVAFRIQKIANDAGIRNMPAVLEAMNLAGIPKNVIETASGHTEQSFQIWLAETAIDDGQPQDEQGLGFGDDPGLAVDATPINIAISGPVGGTNPSVVSPFTP